MVGGFVVVQISKALTLLDLRSPEPDRSFFDVLFRTAHQ
jgi:hypothetical protein